MVREYEWSVKAKRCLPEWRLEPFEVEEAVRLSHHRRTPNEGPADWIIWSELPEGRGILRVRYDWPVREDEARARLVSFWVER
jgi:hypothetical protein